MRGALTRSRPDVTTGQPKQGLSLEIAINCETGLLSEATVVELPVLLHTAY
jgi:hypothetical protein